MPSHSGRFGILLPLIFVFLLIALVPRVASSAQRFAENDSNTKSDILLDTSGVRPSEKRDQALIDADTIPYPNLVSIPIEVNQALDLSLDDILEEAVKALDSLRSLRLDSDMFIGLDADVDDRLVQRSAMLVYRMAKLIGHLQEARRNSNTKPLSNQAPNIRKEGVLLFVLARELHLLMGAKDRCELRNLGLLLGSVETLAITLENGLAETNGSDPDLYYFFFADHLPSVVPQEGGWLYLVGANLWQEDKPQVTLIDSEGKKTVETLVPHQTARHGVMAIKIEHDWITDNTGRCLSLKVSSHDVHGATWSKQRNPATYRHLPICIPQSFDTKYKIAGFLEYETPTQTRLLKAKSMLFENASCTDAKTVTGNLEWTLEPGGRLTDIGESPLYEAGSSSIQCQIAENRISCAGQLGHAVCGISARSGDSPGETELLLEQAEWEHIFTPTAEYSLPEEHHSYALSEVVNLTLPTTQIALMIPREEPSETTRMRYELIIMNGNQQKTVFTSPQKTLAGMQEETYTLDHDKIVTVLDPASQPADAEIRVKIDFDSCPY